MEVLFTFALSVTAGVVSYYICKWLTPSKQEAPSVLAVPRGLLVC